MRPRKRSPSLTSPPASTVPEFGYQVLVLDAAYAEYVRKNDYEAGIELVATTHNTVMTRTFSKIYGLASLRIGWAYCPDAVADALNRIRGPFNVSGPAIATGVAALEDPEDVGEVLLPLALPSRGVGIGPYLSLQQVKSYLERFSQLLPSP